MRLLRKKHIMAGALGVAACICVIYYIDSLQHSRFEQRWRSLEKGMSKDEVRRILGTPENVYPAGERRSDSVLGILLANWIFDSTLEKWSYGRRRLLASQPTFPYIGLALGGFLAPEDDDHVVYFSKDGRVVEKLYSYRDHEHTDAVP